MEQKCLHKPKKVNRYRLLQFDLRPILPLSGISSQPIDSFCFQTIPHSLFVPKTTRVLILILTGSYSASVSDILGLDRADFCPISHIW